MFVRFLKHYLFEVILFLVFLIFSVWLMFSTFGYANGSMLIAAKAWSDFANHIPLIRSFSFGSNFPPQDPLFAGQPTHYHFVFYAAVALLEKMGVRIDYGMNILSTIGFFGLLIMLYVFAKKLFHSTAVATLTTVFFLFNGTLSFLEFFKQHPLTTQSLQEIISNTTFPSFSPYTQTIVSAFWNLNIYTNQRHLAAAFALSLLLVYLVLFYSNRQTNPIIARTKEEAISFNILRTLRHRYSLRNMRDKLLTQIKQTRLLLSLVLGCIFGLSFFFHIAVFLMTVIVLCCMFIFFVELRVAITIILVLAAIIAFPQYEYLRSGEGGYAIRFVPGYLISDNLSFFNFFTYWFYNLGLHFILIPVGAFIAPKQIKKLFLGFFALFMVGNLFQFAPEMAENHKFFNYFLLFGNMLSAYVLVLIWRKNIFYRPLVIVAMFLLIFSGIIDFFPIYNDREITLTDYPRDPNIQWIMQHTPKTSVFLDTSYLYDTASLAGRKIFLGWPYFPWSAGFDTDTRARQMNAMLTAMNKQSACQLLTRYHIDYIEFRKNAPPDPNIPTISSLYSLQFSPVYENTTDTYTVIDVKANCSKSNEK